MLASELYTYLAYASPIAAMVGYGVLRSRRSKRNLQTIEKVTAEGMTEPASLHPVFDPQICVGCGACVTACPEGEVIGMVHGKAQLLHPTKCIGHGACKRSCPFDAITLVFGTTSRGVDIPMVNPNFETNVPGIFIAGELGGMGLIRNAVEQGRQAMENIAKLSGIGKNKGRDDVIIIGAGPAGFAASLCAHEKKLRYRTLEQDSLGGTVFKFPRGKLVMTAPVKLPIVGTVRFRETKKEKLLAFWQEVEKRTQVKINYREKMETITRDGDGFIVKTSKGEYKTRAILLAIGRRGTPRKLGVTGEDQPKVVYSLIDPEQYRDQHVLVVGGGDAAMEAATSIAEEPGTSVILSYRSEAFSRAKEKNRQKVDQMQASGQLKVLLSSNVKEILSDKVRIEQQGKMLEFPNEAVIICAGGILPTPFLKEIGIQVDTKHGTV
ncbi:MAG: 4Fe-4S dicluster domain-containing protein [Gammaproteobacteria bacterium]|nr:4Fe-4S dicluster domain-containing protein [Gammaproteobacteria bacterium]